MTNNLNKAEGKLTNTQREYALQPPFCVQLSRGMR